MKFKVVLWASAVLLALAPAAFAQRSTARTVTNMDLEKYRQQRLRAEEDYARNYERMGFPSPEELKKEIEKSRVEREALSARLAAERIQREQLALEMAEAARMGQDTVVIIPNGGGYFGWPYGGFFPGGRFPRGRQVNWSSRIGNGQPVIDYFGPRLPTPRVIRPRRR